MKIVLSLCKKYMIFLVKFSRFVTVVRVMYMLHRLCSVECAPPFVYIYIYKTNTSDLYRGVCNI
jgi:hypothetical protein